MGICGSLTAEALIVSGKVHVLRDSTQLGEYVQLEYRGSWMPIIKHWHAIMEVREKQQAELLEPTPRWKARRVNGEIVIRRLPEEE